MDFLKNILFDAMVIVGLVAIILGSLWIILNILDKFFRFSKCIAVYLKVKRNIEAYNLENKLIISEDGEITYPCKYDIYEQIQILKKAIHGREEMERFRREHMK